MEVTLQTVSPNAEQQIVEIARVSSSRTDKQADPEKLIQYLIKNHHWSPFEHGFMTLKIVTSKAIGIQLLRHRSFTFQEFSQRYAVVEGMEPIELREQATNNRQSSTEVFNPSILSSFVRSSRDAQTEIEAFLQTSQKLYERLLEAGVARECARMVLPMCTQTTIYMTGPVRSWIHFINLRDDGHAQKEAQEIARECKRIFCEQFPAISTALGWITESTEEGSMNIFAINGHKVQLSTYNAGYESEQEKVKNMIAPDHVYLVDYTVVHSSSTDVYLQEFPGIRFNSVFFKDVEKQSVEDSKKHPDWIRYNS